MRPPLNTTTLRSTALCGASRQLARIQSQFQFRTSRIQDPRSGFTLIELIVSITILVILTALVLAAFQRDDTDRLNASARMLQSYFEGARSRAISDDLPRGVRLIRRPDDRGVVDSVAYIGSPGFDEGTVNSPSFVATSNPSVMKWRVLNSVGGKWVRLAPKSATNLTGRDLIRPGLRIELPRDSGSWFVVSPVDFADTTVPYGLEFTNGFFIEGEYSGPVGAPVDYRLELAPTILPNTEPVQLDNGIVIDLDASQIPTTWRDDPLNAAIPAPTMDFLFDSRGSPTGSIATAGLIHLYVATISDVELARGRLPNHPRSGTGSAPFTPPYVPAVPPVVPKTSPYVLSLFTQAGQVTTSAADFNDVVINATGAAGSDEVADTPFSFARRGREAQ